MKYTTLLLDVDETLLDFKLAENESLKKALSRAGIEPTDDICLNYHYINDALWKALERGEVEKAQIKILRFKQLYEKYGFEGDPIHTGELYVEELSHAGQMLDGARDFLNEITDKFNIYAVTNGIQKVQEGRFEAADIGKYFKDVFISERVGYSKPDKRYFDYVIDAIPEKDISRILVIGDSPTSDIKGAQNSGLECCWFAPHGKDYMGEAMPTYIARSYDDILKIINR